MASAATDIENASDAEMEVVETMNRLRALRKALESDRLTEHDADAVAGVENSLADCVEHLDRVALFLENQ